MQNWGCSIRFGGIFISFLVFFLSRRHISRLEKENKRKREKALGITQDEQKSTSPSLPQANFVKWYMDIIPFISLSICFVLLIDTIFSIFEYFKIILPSPLSYADAAMTVISVVATVTIACFQYRIQRIFDQQQNIQHCMEKKEQDRKEEQRHKMHVQELRERRINALYTLVSCSGLAYNCNLPESIQYFFNTAHSYLIVLKQEDHLPCFFQPDLKIEEEAIKVKAQITSLDKPNQDDYERIDAIHYKITCDSIILGFDDTFFKKWGDELDNFFVQPIRRCRKFDDVKLHVLIEIFAKNTSMEGDKSFYESDKKLYYQISFSLVAAGGYDRRGCFPLKLLKPSINLLGT